MNARPLFFLCCTAAGLGAGLWFSTGSPDLRLSDLTPVWSTNAPPVRQAVEQTVGQTVGPTGGQATPLSSTGYPAAAAGNFTSAEVDAATGTESQRQSSMPTTAVISYHDGIMKVAPSVVSVYAGMKSSAVTPESGQGAVSQGSGVIVDSDGIILTNLHLVEGLDRITVVLSDGRAFPALLIGSDQETDLAVVRIAAANLPFVPLDDAPPLRVGDVVLAIGNPFGVGQTVTQGIVSATHRRVAGGSVWQHFIQIDAAINPGNSGGALINPYGQLVGVNTAVFRGTGGAVGIGFSIPADLLAQVIPQIIEHGSVARGWLGIGVEDLSMYPALQAQVSNGAVITGIIENSPASRGRLQPMDIVTAIDQQPIGSATQLLLAVSAKPPGSPVTLTVLRSSMPGTAQNADEPVGPESQPESLEVSVVLGTRSDDGADRPR